MAQLVDVPLLRERADDYLDYLFVAWGDIPALAAEWDEWDEFSRLTFAVDWPVAEDRLAQLTRGVEQGALSPAQQARFEKLRVLVAQHRPTLQRLLDEGWAAS